MKQYTMGDLVVCPRCHNEWTNKAQETKRQNLVEMFTYGECKRCNIKYTVDGTIIWNINIGKYDRLIWENGKCYLFDGEPDRAYFIDADLPLDISEERLKLLLPFS